MKRIPFYKMSGAGNDFIIIDNRKKIAPEENQPEWARKVCARRMSAGADGLVLVENTDAADFKWRFYNSDGSVAEMCGNAARCVSRFAWLNGIAGENLCFETIAGVIHSEILGKQVRIKMTDPVEFKPEIPVSTASDGIITAGSINTGVPHLSILVEDVESMDIIRLGRELRFHPDFAPAGTNVNFFSRKPDGTLLNRTYERGVENETLACGTGIVATALVNAFATGTDSPVNIISRSNCLLRVHYRLDGDRFSDVYLEGDARIIYTGELREESWNW